MGGSHLNIMKGATHIRCHILILKDFSFGTLQSSLGNAIPPDREGSLPTGTELPDRYVIFCSVVGVRDVIKEQPVWTYNITEKLDMSHKTVEF